MKALVLDANGLSVHDVPPPECPAGHVRVRLHAAALNHRDVYITEGKYAKIVYPSILGSDGCGVVTESPVAPSLLGKRVIIDPSMTWDGDDRAQGAGFTVLGMPTQGTLAAEICVPMDHIHEAPSHLSDTQAAALPLAGVTAWRATMHQGALEAGQTVLITGIGGGVALAALQFAVAAGARVLVSSTSDVKIARAIELGAAKGFNITHDGWSKAAGAEGPVDLVVDSVGGEYINDYTNIVRPGGRIVVYGASRGVVPSLNIHRVFWKQIHLIGSTMGTSKNFADMLTFVTKHNIVPVVDSEFTLDEAPSAFERMKQAQQFGKIVVRCS
ncbi:MAG: zinc-binding dehydrogenase [Ignavibacteria bacterium]|nr:zinc-binding dehydrogenase [Ignavibacteria bacterium]